MVTVPRLLYTHLPSPLCQTGDFHRDLFFSLSFQSCFPIFANFRGFLLQMKASRAQALSLVRTDDCHMGLDLVFHSVLPSLFVTLVPNTETGP